MYLHRHSIKEGTRGRRSFVHVYDHPDGKEFCNASAEGYWASGATHTGFSVRLDDGSPQVSAGIGHVACGWLTMSYFPLSSWLWRRFKITDQDIVMVTIHDGAVWWSIWQPSHEWTSGTPRWRSGNFNPADSLLGRSKLVTNEVVDGPVLVQVPMPEGTYPAEVTISHKVWKRARWPWPSTEGRFGNIDIKKADGSENGYIPVPGKGESAWDCDGDGIFGQSSPARTVEAAIAKLVESALRTRKQYAGRHDYAEPIS